MVLLVPCHQACSHPAGEAMGAGLSLFIILGLVLQSQNHLKEFAPFLARVAKTASERPRAAVALASGSLLRLLLQAAAELAGTCEAEDQVGQAALWFLSFPGGAARSKWQ